MVTAGRTIGTVQLIQNGSSPNPIYSGTFINNACSATTTPTTTPTLTPTQTPSLTPTSTLLIPNFTSTPTPTPNSALLTPNFPFGLYPNPITGPSFHLVLNTSERNFKIRIFTVAFRKVREMDLANMTVGTSDLLISTTDEWGNFLANGLYYAVILTPKSQTILPMLIQR
jgi:hypothetical protein